MLTSGLLRYTLHSHPLVCMHAHEYVHIQKEYFICNENFRKGGPLEEPSRTDASSVKRTHDFLKRSQGHKAEALGKKSWDSVEHCGEPTLHVGSAEKS